MAKTYTPVGWEDGTLIKNATVTIGGDEYEVTPELVSGTTPINATNLKHMDEAIADLYEHGATSNVIVVQDEEPTDETTVVWVDTDEEGYGSVSELERVYPVGSIYMSTTEANPQTLFGFGTWEQIKDRFLLAAGDNHALGTTGGEEQHTLTIEEIPSHRHGRYITTNEPGGSIGEWNPNYQYLGINNWQTAEQIAVGDAGGGQPHNIMPPYLTVYMWTRIA